MSRLPIRLRLTLAFAGVMAVVLVATGLFLYLRLGEDLDEGIDRALAARVQDLSRPVGTEDEAIEPGELAEEGQAYAQVVDPRSGRVLDGAPPLDGSVLTAAERAEALGHPLRLELVLPGTDDPSRLLATRVDKGDQPLIVVAGASLEDREDALESLATLLLLGGPLSLLLASMAGYGVASAALRPVDTMQRRAAAVSEADLGQRLPVPATSDEVSRLGITLNAMLDRLEAAFARERAFVSDASHELRTPLAILRAELELALKEGRSVADLQAAMASALEETDRLTRLADDLLLLARSDEGRLKVHSERFDAGELLRRVGERFSPRAGETGRRIAIEEVDGLTLEADRLRCEQALGNLVDNALRYGGGDISVFTRARDGDSVELHVSDEGPGFSRGLVGERAFKRFARGDEVRSSEGTGLGLSIVHAIARAHRGEARAANGDAGADVWFSVPRAS